jgi:hypothetical protein
MHERPGRRRRIAYGEGGCTARGQILPAIRARQV